MEAWTASGGSDSIKILISLSFSRVFRSIDNMMDFGGRLKEGRCYQAEDAGLIN